MTTELTDQQRYQRRKQAANTITDALRRTHHEWHRLNEGDWRLLGDIAVDALGDLAAEILTDGTLMKALRFENGQAVLELEPAREILLTLVASMRTMLDSHGAENYLETEITAKPPAVALDLQDGQHPEDAYTVTIQRRYRPTPHEFRQRAEKQRDEILRIVSAWCTEANDTGGIDAGDLAWRLQQAGYQLPDDED